MLREWLAVGVVLLSLAGVAPAAQTAPMSGLEQNVAKASNPLRLPDAPTPVSTVTRDAPALRQTNEILADDTYHPLTKHQKWVHFLHRTYSSATFLGVAEGTVFSRATGGFLYCCGIKAWGERYGAGLADTESRQFFGDLLFPTLLKQDPRYFPKRRGNVFGRAWYAATRVVVTRNDSGHEAFNYSEVLGVAFTRALSNAYYPERFRGGSSNLNNILGTFQSDATSNLVREFWPEIIRIVHKHTPKSLKPIEERLPIPNSTSQY
jgi:hypothetical protein